VSLLQPELLGAADIIRTVAITPPVDAVGGHPGIVLDRMFVSLSLAMHRTVPGTR
jgi:hypothetical protein